MLRQFRPRNFSYLGAALLLLILALLPACSRGGGGSSSNAKPITPYCPYLPSLSFSSGSVHVAGKAAYQARYLGNGSVTNGTALFTVLGSYGIGTTYSFNVGATTINSSGQLTATLMINDLAAKINANGATNVLVTASAGVDALTKSLPALKVTLKNPQTVLHYTSIQNLAPDGGNPKPIRYAEVRVTSTDGTVVQCAETDATGAFSFNLPNDGATYSVNVAARSSNDHNTAYILNNPTDNTFYQISQTVTTTGDSTSLWLVAPATGTLEGGAFNILDQIENAQDYLRANTTLCSTYDTGCVPFTTAPVLHLYWSPGVSPGTYFGISGGISFYLNGKNELYLLGGINGDTTFSDMDHFDNSVIIHEYGHFIEDNFGKPNSPGGSHNGNSLIDPRLAWGEGWADFFQAAVTGYPFYRDTIGNVDCSSGDATSCTHTAFLEPVNTPYDDVPSEMGEGNFREFSITRALYAALNLAGSTSPFSEIWATMHGPRGMVAVDDPFKTIGRFHSIQQNLSSARDWSTLRNNEMQLGNTKDYANPVALVPAGSCAKFPVAMAPVKSGSDDGSFAKSNQFKNNDFYRYDHPGGHISLSLSYTKPSSGGADLDLYLYKPNFVFGSSDNMAGFSNSESDRNPDDSSKGLEIISADLPAGTYMINVMAYTGVAAGSATNYTMSLNGNAVCPQY